MSTVTFDEFAEKFVSVQHDLMRDNGGASSLCKVMHRDLRLGETPSADSDEWAERARALGTADADPDMLDFTEEHVALHMFLEHLRVEALMRGVSASEVLAAMFVIGRRYGMREAAEMMADSTLPPEDGND